MSMPEYLGSDSFGPATATSQPLGRTEISCADCGAIGNDIRFGTDKYVDGVAQGGGPVSCRRCGGNTFTYTPIETTTFEIEFRDGAMRQVQQRDLKVPQFEQSDLEAVRIFAAQLRMVLDQLSALQPQIAAVAKRLAEVEAAQNYVLAAASPSEMRVLAEFAGTSNEARLAEEQRQALQRPIYELRPEEREREARHRAEERQRRLVQALGSHRFQNLTRAVEQLFSDAGNVSAEMALAAPLPAALLLKSYLYLVEQSVA